MSSTRSPGADSRRQHRSGLPPSVSTCTASRLPASSAPVALMLCSCARGIGSKMSLPSAGIPATICSEGCLVILGRRWGQSEREVRLSVRTGPKEHLQSPAPDSECLGPFQITTRARYAGDLIGAFENFIDGWDDRYHPFTWTKPPTTYSRTASQVRELRSERL